MSWFVQTYEREPAVINGAALGLLDAVLILVVAFGVPITIEQKTAIVVVVQAVLAVAAAFVTRSQVSPVASLPTPPP